MSDELELNLDEETNRADERITKLSTKVKETATQRDEANAKAENEAAGRQAAEKERDFFKTFTGVSSKYQGASEYQDKILEKYNAGYSIEDATVSVLNAEGKFNPTAPAPVYQGQATGGSAATTIQSGESQIGDMSREDKRQALMQTDNNELIKALRSF